MRIETRTARLLVLMRLQDDGFLDGLSQAEIGRRMGVNRSTILRDLQVIKNIRSLYRKHVLAWADRAA